MNMPMKSSEASPERVYLNPPVVEALCEVFFTSTSWDDSTPDRFFEEFKVEFPKRQKRIFNEARVTVDNDEAVAEVTQLPTWEVFLTESEDRLIQISDKHITFNQLKPYRPFGEWENHFYDALSVYKELTSPQVIERLGVRYINKIEIPGRRITMEEYFTIFPVLPKGSEGFHGPFMIRCNIPQSAENHVLTMIFSTIEPDETIADKQFFLLDLQVQMLIGKHLDEVELKNQIRLAHESAVNAFEGSITDNLRTLFDRGDVRHE